jgi:regulatory protein
MNPKRKKQKKNSISVMHKAVSFLARRSYGIEELRRKLTSASYESEEIEETLARLVEMEYLDDHVYARAYIHDQMRLRRKGPITIRSELIGKKVAKETINQVLAELYTEKLQWENIIALIDKWKHSSVNYTEQQLMRKLIQKGYALAMASRALDELPGEQGFLDTP